MTLFYRRSNAGSTLIEVMLTTLIVAMIVAVIFAAWWYFQKNYQESLSLNQSLENAYSTTERITTDLRQMYVSDSGAYPLVTANDHEIAFYANVDADSSTERVRYYLVNGVLYRGIINPTGSPAVYDTDTEVAKIVVSSVVNNTTPIFYYYNSSWPLDTTNNPLSASNRISQTQYITIKLLVQIDEPAPITVTRSIYLRNL